MDFLKNEKSICAQIEALCMENPDEALSIVLNCIDECTDEEKKSRAQSAALSRICCRFLMHRKLKSRLIGLLTQDDKISRPLFNELNTYKYSLVFLLRRLVRLNDLSLTKKLMDFLSTNPYRDDSSKDYSDRWSMNFIINEVLNAPDDYLSLEKENEELILSYKTI